MRRRENQRTFTALENRAVRLTSKMNSRYKATIPPAVRKALRVNAGDFVSFEINGHEVRQRRFTPVDLAFSQALEGTLGEWHSAADEPAFKGL